MEADYPKKRMIAFYTAPFFSFFIAAFDSNLGIWLTVKFAMHMISPKKLENVQEHQLCKAMIKTLWHSDKKCFSEVYQNKHTY